MFLTLDLPPTPLFQDANKHNIIAQVRKITLVQSLNDLLSPLLRFLSHSWLNSLEPNPSLRSPIMFFTHFPIHIFQVPLFELLNKFDGQTEKVCLWVNVTEERF